jgi:hypothetical protein
MYMKWNIEKQIVRNREDAVYLDGSRPTPDSVLDMMAGFTMPTYEDRTLVLFDPAIALHMRSLGVVDITLYLTTINDRMRPWFDECGIQVVDSLDDDMKFDLGLINPPYKGKAALHQQFFNRTLDLLVDGGRMVSIQPATPYVNNKERKKSAEVAMLKNIEDHTTNVKLVNGPDIFPDAQVFGQLAITHLVKDYEGDGALSSLEYPDGTIYQDIPIESVNFSATDPTIFLSIKKKVEKYISEYGCVQDVIVEEFGGEKFKMPKIRGHIGNVDMFTFISKDSDYDREDTDHGIEVDNEKQRRNIRLYLETHVARFCLSLLKFNGNSHMGELKLVPLVNFNYKWDDESLCELFGITKKEYKEIRRVIPDYY